jgi:hypothetical protein
MVMYHANGTFPIVSSRPKTSEIQKYAVEIQEMKSAVKLLRRLSRLAELRFRFPR